MKYDGLQFREEKTMSAKCRQEDIFEKNVCKIQLKGLRVPGYAFNQNLKNAQNMSI